MTSHQQPTHAQYRKWLDHRKGYGINSFAEGPIYFGTTSIDTDDRKTVLRIVIQYYEYHT